MSKPVLVLGCGNPSRGDDALGPLLLKFIEQNFPLTYVEVIDNFQLQVEHALDMQNRKLILFVDAALGIADAFSFQKLLPAKDLSYSSHAMSPAAVLHVYQTITGLVPPPSFLLAIQAIQCELGGDLSVQATRNLHLACDFTKLLLAEPKLTTWEWLIRNQC
ncbi:MAG: hydrogenase maturation protease [Methylomonas sp.]|jgi:hydrogenase maturation protease